MYLFLLLVGILCNWVMLGGLIFVLAKARDPVGSLNLHKVTNGYIDMDTLIHRRVTRIRVWKLRRLFRCLMRDENSYEAFFQITGYLY